MDMTDTCKCGQPFSHLMLMVDGVRLCDDCYLATVKSFTTPELDFEEARAMEAQRWDPEIEEDWP